MTDLATIRIPVDSSDMVQAVKESRNLERAINMLVEAFDSGAIGSGQLSKGLLQLKREYEGLFTSSQQATARIREFAGSLIESKSAADAATASKQNLALATKKAETAFALANQKAKEELQTLRNRAEFAYAMAMQRERESQAAVRAAEQQAKAEQRLAQEILKRRQAQEQVTAKGAQSFQSQIGSNLGLGAQGVSASASASVFEQQIESLRQKYDKLYVAQTMYKQMESELRQVEALGIISKEKMSQELDKLAAEYQQYITAAEGAALVNNRFAQGVQQSMGGLNNSGVLIQQLGYQAGDFAVQVQSGTNAFVAFGQQATQLVGFLPMLAQELNIAKVAFMGMSIPIAPLMLGLSVLIPVLTAVGAYFSRTASESDAAGEALKQYEQVLEGLNSKLEETKVRLEAMRRGLASDDLFAATLAIEDLNSQLNTLMTTEVSGFFDAFSRGDRIAAVRILRNELESQLETLKAQLAEEQRLETAERRRANERRNQYREAVKDAQNFRDVLLQALGAMKSMAETNLSAAFQNAMPALESFVGALRSFGLGRAYGMAVGRQGMLARLTELDDERGSQRESSAGFRTKMPEQPWLETTTTSGGGGGRAGNSNIEGLINQLQTEREVLEEWYAESQQTLMSASQSELAIIGGANEAKLRLQEEYYERLRKIDEDAGNSRLALTQNILGGIADIAAASGGKMEKASRAFAAAEALINVYRAQAQVLADPKLSFFQKIPAMLAVGAAGMRVVQAIRSGSSTSGASGGGSRGSASVASTASAPAPQTVFIDSIEPEALYSGETLINLFDAFYNENDKRGKVFVVNR
jgi:hypothetical protein